VDSYVTASYIEDGYTGFTGYIIWNNSTQISATALSVSHIDELGNDIDIFLSLISSGDKLIIQDRNNSNSYQQWLVSSSLNIISNNYVEIPVSLITATGLGYTNFPNQHEVILVISSIGATGPQGYQGNTGSQGADGTTGSQGNTGTQGLTGPQGAQGPNFGFFFTSTAPSTTGLTAGTRWFDSSSGIEFVLINDGNSLQWVEPLSTNSGGGGGGGGAGSQGSQGLQGPTGSPGSQGDTGSIGPQGPAGSSNISVIAGSDPDVISGMSSTPVGTYDLDGNIYDIYRINAKITVPGGINVYTNYIGTVTIGGSTFKPHATQGLVDSQDPGGFGQVQSSLTTGALVYDETLTFAAPVDLMTVNYDNTLSAVNDYHIFFIGGNTNHFSCSCFVDYLFYVENNDTISFTN
jgi:hypothetical protein